MDIRVDQADIERWIGQLYIELCQWRKAAQEIDQENEHLKALLKTYEADEVMPDD